MASTRAGATLAALTALCLGILADPAQAAEPYVVNAILPLSGGGSFLGNAEQRSLELAAALANRNGGINGRPLQFVFHDDQSSPQTAVQLATRIIAQHPPLIVGPSIVAMCNATAPLMRNGPVQYCLSPGIHPPAGSYTFTASVSTFDLANALIRYFRLKGWTRIALMTSTDASGQDAERGLNQIIAMPDNKDVTVVERAHFNPSDVSVAAQIERVKAASPQAFIAWSTGAPIATIFRAVNQGGLDIPIGTTDGNMTHAQMEQYDAFLPPRLYFPAALWAVAVERGGKGETVSAAQQQFLASFAEAGVLPDLPAEIAWDPAMILIEALRRLGPDVTAEQLRDHLAHLKDFAGVNGTYDFEKEPQRGLTVENAVVTRWNRATKHWDVVAKPTGVPLEN
ncbi:MAG TPA: ABC transporter substrate-binding protein [Stellaceae bacterium]|nr:ABC transporter substrate-binding protein [Stellaceae bacterium]